MQTEIIRKTLNEFEQTLSHLDNTEFTMPIESLSGSTIGEHTRHIIELFQCLMNGYEAGTVNYDKRKRNTLIQTDIGTARQYILWITGRLKLENKNLTLFYELNHAEDKIETNFNRELLHNFEHCIHHQALIKVGLLELDKNIAGIGFGIAESTLKYREKCAQ